MDDKFFKSKFDWKAYVAKYGDLQKANADTEEKVWTHAQLYGHKENRDIFNGDKKLLQDFQHFCVTGDVKSIPDKYKSLNNPKIIKMNENKKIYTTLTGGFGNQMFMIFNIIALSKQYNKEFELYYDESYIKNYYTAKNVLRESASAFKIFKNLTFKKNNNIDEYLDFQESGFKYDNIQLENNENYSIKGFFQSYKYFWEYKEEIKKYLFIDYEKIELIKNLYNSYNKKILSIHIRLTDYETSNNYHFISSIEYYKQALSHYNLNDYQIILFSDDIEKAKNKLAPLNLHYISADELYTGVEDQFYMLCLSNVRVCASSSFSLMSCYINEMYNFVNDTEYNFSSKWFGYNGPEYDIYDVIPINNPKYKIINNDNKTYGVFLIATGNYIQYLDTLIHNIKDNLLPHNKKIIFVTTDDISYLDKFNNLLDNNFHIISNYQQCRGFPADTMYRFEYFLNFKELNFDFGEIKNIQDVDYVLFLNLNLKIQYKIYDLPHNNKELFFCKHPGNVFNNMFDDSIEKRKEVSCYINIENIDKENKIYICGGFNGGQTKSYLKMCEKLKENTIRDDKNELVAIWHDESQINWYRTQINRSEYCVLDYLYCCPENYNNKTYIDIINKNHKKIRLSNNMTIDFTTDLNTDLLRMLYLMYNYNQDISLPILNMKYNFSSRNGLLKNFFRFDQLSQGMDKNAIQYNTETYNLILDSGFIKKFIEGLNLNVNDSNDSNFIEKYKEYNILHISKKFEKYRYNVYNYCKNNCDTKFLLVFHDKKYIDDEIWKNLNNIEKYNFNNDEEKLLLTSKNINHVFYDLNDVFILLFISKFSNKNVNNLRWIYNFKNNNQELAFMKENFNIETIDCDLKPGFSFIIRAKNETLNVDYCLKSIEPILTLFPSSEIIFVDNNSSDGTFEKANSILSKYNNTLVLKYNVDIPPCGEKHKEVVKDNPHLSLGTFYKWCYSFSSKNIVIKWDCDFLCNLQNLIQLIHTYNLNNNIDDISCWFSGKQIFIKDDIVIIDTKSYYLYNEPRVQSKLNGFEYEDSKDLKWETPYTDYLIKNEKNNKSYHYGFPTSYYIVRYLESINKNINYNNKNIYEYFDDLYESQDKDIILEKIKKNNDLYLHVNDFYKEKEESPIFYEMKNVDYLMKKLNNLKKIDKRDITIHKLLNEVNNNNYDKNILCESNYLKMKMNLIIKKPKICLLVLVCDKYEERMKKIQEYLKVFNYDYLLIKADDNINNPILENNILTVNCEECYENLPKKMILAYKYLFENTDYDYFLKIDDDTQINEKILQKYIDNNFYHLDYLGGIAGGGVELDWHFGKCKNKELNSKPYWNGYNGDWCGGGFGYILSKYAISLLLKEDNFKYIYDEIYEDKAIGDILRKEKILPSFEYLPDLKISKKLGMEGDDYIFICNH